MSLCLSRLSRVALRVCDAFEKIRVNPGNFADGINKFEDLTYEIRAEYTDDVFFFLGISSPQLHASGRLRDFPNGVPVLLKEASVPELKHRRSLSSPNLSPAGQMGALEFSESEESDSSSSTNHSNGKSICSFFFLQLPLF